MDDIIKWLVHKDTDSCLLRILKILFIVIILGVGFSAFLIYLFELYQGGLILWQYRGQWAGGDMSWMQMVDILPPLAFLLFILGCGIFFVYALIKSFDHFLKKKDVEESEIKSILTALLARIEAHDKDIQDIKERLDKYDGL